MRRGTLLAVALWGALAATAAAHPIHSSVAEADFNRATGKLEVSLRVFADDFETALGDLAGKKISLEKSPPSELDALVRAYLVGHFIVKAPSGALASLRLIGRELKDAADELWLHFELDLPGGVAGIRVDDTVLRERFSDQLNSVRVRDGDRQLTLVFLPGRGEQTVRFPP